MNSVIYGSDSCLSPLTELKADSLWLITRALTFMFSLFATIHHLYNRYFMKINTITAGQYLYERI